MVQTTTTNLMSVTIPAGVELPYETADIYIDEDENVYYKGSVHVERDKKMSVVLLSAGQVEVLCNVLGAVREEVRPQ